MDKASTEAELRVLCALPNPSDQPKFHAETFWQAVDDASRLFEGNVYCKTLERATEINVDEQLKSGHYKVFYFAGHAECIGALNYANIVFESSSGKARKLDGKYFAGLLAAHHSLEVVVLQACDQASFCFELIAQALIEKGARAVVMLPTLTAAATGSVMAKLFGALSANMPLDSLLNELRGAHPDANTLKVSVNGIVQPEEIDCVRSAPPWVRPAQVVSKVPPVGGVIEQKPVPDETSAQKLLRAKRESGHFDVFLCHNSFDKRAVMAMGQRLKKAGILPWLDLWELPPGKPWQPELERQLPAIRSAAVFVGAAGVGPWQEGEVHAFLDEFVKRHVPVIPVLLHDVVNVPVLPIFLRLMTWVDFRIDDPDPFERLIWGITGQRPED